LDPYIRYLVQLSATNPVVVTKDIVDTSGKLIVRQSTLFDRVIYDQLVGLTFPQPLEHYLQLSCGLSASELLARFVNTINSSNSFLVLNERKSLLPIVETAIAVVDKLPLLQQKLRVMAELMPAYYERTIFVSIWVLLIGREMRLPIKQLQQIFLAGLAHDIGMLHVEPAILQKTNPLSVSDWVCIQEHVVIAQQLLANNPYIPDEVITAVGEHHERCDATGYPLGKVESELSLEGQILALADALVGIYYNRCKQQGRHWRDVIPVLEMNAAAYLYRSCELVQAIISRSELPLAQVVSGGVAAEFAARMLQQNISLQLWFTTLRDYLTQVGYTHGDRRLHSLQNVVFHIATTFKGNMLFDDKLRDSLKSLSLADGINLTPEIEEASLLQQEMTYHLQRLSRMIQSYIAAGGCKDATINAQLQQGLAKISGYL